MLTPVTLVHIVWIFTPHLAASSIAWIIIYLVGSSIYGVVNLLAPHAKTKSIAKTIVRQRTTACPMLDALDFIEVKVPSAAVRETPVIVPSAPKFF